MNGYQYILAKQTEWAKNHGLDLIGSKKTVVALRTQKHLMIISSNHFFQTL